MPDGKTGYAAGNVCSTYLQASQKKGAFPIALLLDPIRAALAEGTISVSKHESPKTMRFFAFILGFLILIGGLAWGAIEAGAPILFVQIGSVILLGLGIILGASNTRNYRSQGDVTVVRDQDPL